MPGGCAYRCDPTGALPAPKGIDAYPDQISRLNTMPATKRVYVQNAHIIATALTDASDVKTQAAIADVAKQLADMFKHDSREFRYDRFFPPCRLGPRGELLPNPVHRNTNGSN
jgi:hypothetical protein